MVVLESINHSSSLDIPKAVIPVVNPIRKLASHLWSTTDFDFEPCLF